MWTWLAVQVSSGSGGSQDLPGRLQKWDVVSHLELGVVAGAGNIAAMSIPDRNADGMTDLLISICPTSRLEQHVPHALSVMVVCQRCGQRVDAASKFEAKWSEVSQFGFSVGHADIDGDNTPDLVIGSPRPWQGEFRGGWVSVHAGKDGRALWFQEESASTFGRVVAFCPDYDGDSIPDVAASSSVRSDTSSLPIGRVRIYSSASGKLIQDLENPDRAVHFGAALYYGEDYDHDGKREFIVGSPTEEDGEILVYSGIDGHLIRRIYHAAGRFGTCIIDSIAPAENRPRELLVGAPAARVGDGNVRGAVYAVSIMDWTPRLLLYGELHSEFGSSIIALPSQPDSPMCLVAVGSPDADGGIDHYGGGEMVDCGRLQLFDLIEGRELFSMFGSEPGSVLGAELIDVSSGSRDPSFIVFEAIPTILDGQSASSIRAYHVASR